MENNDNENATIEEVIKLMKETIGLTEEQAIIMLMNILK